MITSKIIRKKNEIVNKLGQAVTDLIYSTFKFPSTNASSGVVIVNDFEAMRPDLVSNRVYADQNKWDALLKYNGISNPFSLEPGDILYVLPYSEVDSSYKSPNKLSDRKGKDEAGGFLEIPGNAGDDSKDQNRINNLRAKGAAKTGITTGKDGSLPPNVSKKGDKSVKVKDGKLVFGEDVTTINKDNCPVPISRARLQAALIKDRLFL